MGIFQCNNNEYCVDYLKLLEINVVAKPDGNGLREIPAIPESAHVVYMHRETEIGVCQPCGATREYQQHAVVSARIRRGVLPLLVQPIVLFFVCVVHDASHRRAEALQHLQREIQVFLNEATC